MKLTEKTAYLKGFYEGLDLTDATEATRIIGKLVEALDDAAAEIARLEEKIGELEEYVDEIDEGLGDVEETVYEPHRHCPPPPPHHHCDCDECDDEDYDDFDDEDYDDCDDIIEVECPGCDETICLPTTIDLAHVICPACGEEFSCICDCDDCDCEDCEECCDCGDDEGK